MASDKSRQSSSKNKRQRRSYSCGPCKLLKIKCDLSLPCSSCVKLKRVDKCKLLPPNPPSPEELRVIEERRHRLSKRHQKLASENKSSSYKSASSTASPAPSVSPSTFVDDAADWHEHIMYHLHTGANNLTLLESSTIDVDTIPAIPSHKVSTGLSIFRADLAHDFLVMITLAPEEFKDMVEYLPTPEQAAVLIEKYLKAVNQDLFELLDFKYICRWGFPLIYYIIANKDKKTVQINLISYRILACLLSVLATGLLLTPSVTVKNLDNNEVIAKYIELSRRLKNNFKSSSTLLDIINLIIWYLVIESYYTYSNSFQEHYFEYTNLLSTLLFNERCMKCIVNKDITEDSPANEVAEFKLVSKFWFRLRIVELENSYFQYKSSLLNSNIRFKNSISPNHRYLTLVYDEDLSEVKFEHQRFVFRATELYFDQFTESGIDFEKIKLEKSFIHEIGADNKASPVDVVKLVKSYLTIHCKCYSSVKSDVDAMEKTLTNTSSDKDYARLVNEQTLGLYLKNQIVQMIFAKWLSFVKVESWYFPSLRYCTYYTSMLCMFNHFNRLDDIILQHTHGKSNIVNELLGVFNYYQFRGVIAPFVFSQFFLMALKNFTCARARDQGDCSLDIRKYFDAVHCSFTTTFQKLLRYFNSSPLRLVPCFQTGVSLVCNMNYVYTNVVDFDAGLNINRFLNLVLAHLPHESWNLLVEHHFGSRTTLVGYMDCVWDLLKFLRCTPRAHRIPMLAAADFSLELVLGFQHSLMGFALSDDVVDDYIEVVVKPGVTARLVPRDSFTMVLQNAQTFYLTEISVGSNADSVRVLVDTGLSDLWVMSHEVSCYSSSNSRARRALDKKDDVASEVPLGPAGGAQSALATSTRALGASNTCTSYGSFDTAASDSFRRNDSAPLFEIQYADGTSAVGVWGHDNVTVHGVSVLDLSFAVVNQTSSNIGVFGIGLPGLETTYSSGSLYNRYTYQNFPEKLKSEGIIAKNAYSLYLGRADDSTGTILFGAVDHAKYSGTLRTVPIVNSLLSWGYRSAIRLEINLTGLSLNNSRTSADITSSAYAALLDTGTTLTYVPQTLLSYIAELLDALYSSSIGAYIIDCDALESTTNTVWDFSGVQISAPLSDFVLRVTRSTCVLGIFPQSSDDNYILLGDNFLRSAYVVYDLDDLTVSLAQVNYTDDEDIEVISSSIPRAETVSTAATAAGTGGPVASGAGTFAQSRTSGRSSASATSDSETTTRTGGSGHYTPHALVVLASALLSALLFDL